jgi:5-deoxy-glucuronate isomerase
MKHTRLRVLELDGTESFEADSLIAVEVLTPGGNWSSYPPHRHDGLEEIYYYEVAGGGFAFQRVYDGMDVLEEVRTGDRIEMPCGWTGVSA